MSNIKNYFGPSARAPKFSTHIPQLYVIKICFSIKVNTICDGGQLLVSGYQESICHKFNSHSPGLGGSGSQGLGFQVPMSQFQAPGCQKSGSQSPKSQGPSSQLPRSQSGSDFRLCHFMSTKMHCCLRFFIYYYFKWFQLLLFQY